MNIKPSHRPARAAIAAAGLAILLLAAPTAAAAATSEWAPVASEKLTRLPGDSLRKAVDNDFARSPLAQHMSDIDEQVAYKRLTLEDLQNAVERAGDAKLQQELQQQFLNEKRNYLELVREHQELRRQRAITQIALYERLLDRVRRDKRAKTPEQAAIIASQTEARERFEASVGQVDARLLQSTMTAQSRYAREYAQNLGAVEALVAAINAHPMNAAPAIDGRAVTREEYLRQLVADSHGALAIVDQERTILRHMAKLVALDALALSEGIAETTAPTELAGAPDASTKVSSSVDFFITR